MCEHEENEDSFYKEFHIFCRGFVEKLKEKEKKMFYPEFNGDISDITQNDIINPYPNTDYDFIEDLISYSKSYCKHEIFNRFKRRLERCRGVTKAYEADLFAHQFAPYRQEFPVLAKSINKDINIRRYGSCPFIIINYSFSEKSISRTEDDEFFFNTYKKYLKYSLDGYYRSEGITISPNSTVEKNNDEKSLLDDDHNNINEDLRDYKSIDFSYSFKDLEETLPGRMVKEIMGQSLYSFFYNIISYSVDREFINDNGFTKEFHMGNDTFERSLETGRITQGDIDHYFAIHKVLNINELKDCMTKIILFALYRDEFSRTGEDISIKQLRNLFNMESREFCFIFNKYIDNESREYRNIIPTTVYHHSPVDIIVTNIIRPFKKSVRDGGKNVWGEKMTPKKTILQNCLISVCESKINRSNYEDKDFWGQMNIEISRKN